MGELGDLKPGGEIHLGCHNYTGPGTVLEPRGRAEPKPYNAIDACSRQHDWDYEYARNATDVHNADKRAIACYWRNRQHSDVSAGHYRYRGQVSAGEGRQLDPAQTVYVLRSHAAKDGWGQDYAPHCA